MIVGRLIPAGTGLAYHTKRRQAESGLSDLDLETLRGTAAPAPFAAGEAEAAPTESGAEE